MAAVHLVENESITKLNQLPIKEASQTLLEFRSKSHTPSGVIDRDQLTPQDRAVYDSILRNTMAPVNRETTFIGVIEGLKNIVKAADLKFQTGKKDATDSGGDINAVGQTMNKMTLEKRITFGLAPLNAISKTFPSEWVQQQEQMQQIIQQSTGAQPK